MRTGDLCQPIQVSVELDRPVQPKPLQAALSLRETAHIKGPGPMVDSVGKPTHWRASASSEKVLQADLLLVHTFYSGFQDSPVEAEVQGNRCVWREKEKWARRILLAGDPAALAQVKHLTIEIGGRTVADLSRPLWQQQCPVWKDVRVTLPPGWEVREATASLPQSSSIFPFCRVLLNYPGDTSAVLRSLLHTALHPLFLMIVATLILATTARFWLPQRFRSPAALDELLSLDLLQGRESTEPARREGTLAPTLQSRLPSPHPAPFGRRNVCVSTWLWGLAGLVLVVGCLWFLEVRQPYYFTQDDNFSQFLPGIVGGCRAMWAGERPDWNPYQCLGAPLAEVGTYALTYPVTWLSYAVARNGFGDELATLEVFCWLHLLAGYAACFWLGRRLGLFPPTAAALALCWTLSGYALIGGRSWYYMTPSFVWYPLLIGAALGLRRPAPGWRWVLATSLVIGLFFHAGNAQMWAYGMVVFALLVIWEFLSGEIPRGRLVPAAAALTIGLGLAAILIVPQFLAIQDLDRKGGSGNNIFSGVHAIFFPYPIAQISKSFFWTGTEGLYTEQFYYAGSVFSLAWLLAVILAVGVSGRGKAFWKNPFLALSMIVFVLAMGRLGGLWELQAVLPVFNKFGHAVKYLPLFHVLALSAGAVFVEQVLRRSPLASRWRLACVVAVTGLMLYHVSLARPSFYTFADRPYPQLPSNISKRLQEPNRPARVLPICPLRSPVVGYVLSLQHNFPTIYRIDALTGYDPLVEKRSAYLGVTERLKTDFPDALRRYGVTDVLLHRLAKWPQWSGNHLALLVETESLYLNHPVRDYCDRRRDVGGNEQMEVLAVDDPDPLAFPVHDRRRALPLERTAASVTVDVSSLAQGGPVVVNYLWYPRIRVRMDGVLRTASADRYGRILVDVPRGTRMLTVDYRSPWLLGTGVGLGLIVAGVVGYVIAGRLAVGRPTWGAPGPG
jgi:hypothetical protein